LHSVHVIGSSQSIYTDSTARDCKAHVHSWYMSIEQVCCKETGSNGLEIGYVCTVSGS
jgi:hypothetical protein